jgi:plastocyanin
MHRAAGPPWRVRFNTSSHRICPVRSAGRRRSTPIDAGPRRYARGTIRYACTPSQLEAERRKPLCRVQLRSANIAVRGGTASASSDMEQISLSILRSLFMQARILVVAFAFTVYATAACGGGGGATSTTPTTPVTPVTPVTPASPNDVLVQNNSFTPATVTVAAGSTVKWTWATCSGSTDPYAGGAGQTCVDHSVAWDAGGTGSATQQVGTYQRAFATAGTYAYHCAVHGSAMSGKVVVQ